MTGQGRPLSFVVAHARWALALAICAVVSIAANAQNATTPAEPMRLQITWGGGDANIWVGQIALDQGTLADLKFVAPSADAAGSVWLEPTGLRIRALSPHKVDSVELAATAPAEAKLLVELSANAQSQPVRVQVPVAELARRPFQMRLDERGNTFEVHVIPNPTLKIAIAARQDGDSNLIFTRGEQLTFQVEPLLPASLHGTTLDIQTALVPARHKDAIWNDTQKLAVPVDRPPRAELTVPLQVAEGVYTVQITVARPSGYFRDKFFPGAAAAIAERSFQIVVLDPQPAASNEAGKWEQVLEIDPTNPRWADKLPQWTQLRRLPGINNISHGALGSVRAGAVDLPLGRFIELPPTVGNGDPHWQSYSLPLQATGVPHLLEIDYPADKDQHFGLSIVEPNAAGVIQGTQRDAGVFVEGLGRSEAKQKETHRVVFWPRTQSPLLVITNQHPTAAAHFGRIRVLRRAGLLNPVNAQEVSRNRLVATYVARPLLAESLGVATGSESLDPARILSAMGGYPVAYESAARLAEYSRFSGFNSAVVSVVANGTAYYPRSRTLPTFGPVELAGSDSVGDVDGLELLLRVFDREHLTLIPAVEFAGPIARLEELRRMSDSQPSGLELIGPDGRTWLEANGSRNGLAPYYNVLDPRVQQAMLEVVAEIKQRYGAHASFGGVAVQLSSDGYSQLPPLEWGLDDTTIERFARDTGIAIAGPGPNRFAARQSALTGPHAAAWRSWRGQLVAAFYQRMAAMVNDNSERHLLLTTERLFEHPLVRDRVRPNLLADNRVVPTMLDLGIDRSLLEQIPGVVLCPTKMIEPATPLADRAVDLEINGAFARWNSNANVGGRGATLYHPNLAYRIASFNAVSPFRMAGEMRVASRPLPAGLVARQPYAQAIEQSDSAVLLDGGEGLPLGQEELLRNVRLAIAALPTGAQTTELEKQAVFIRSYETPRENMLLVVNTAPWHVAAQVAFDVSAATTLEPLQLTESGAAHAAQPVSLAAGRQLWNQALEPYDVQVIRVAGGHAQVMDIDANLEPAAIAEIKSQLDDLAGRDLSAPRVYRGLANPSFEPMGGGSQVVGWHLVGNAKTASATLDQKSPQDGKTSLTIRNSGPLAVVESEPFAVPATGQLSMTVFARGQNIGPTTDLRLVFEVETEGQVFRRQARVAGAQTQRANQQWGRPFAILVNDLPMNSRTQMRIKFELTGLGELWLDNITLNDLLFPQKFYPQSQAEIVKLLQRMHEVQSTYEDTRLKDCMQLLDGYWPRFVLAYTPPTTPVVALGATPEQIPSTPPSAVGPPPNTEPPANGFQDRLKRMVPILR